MKKAYDFSKGKRGVPLSGEGKSRITIYLDNEILTAFREQAEQSGRGYQSLINDALREYIATTSRPLDARTLRRILREELEKVS